MSRQLKALEFDFSLHGTKFNIPLCCIIFFESVWRTNFRADLDLEDWYSNEFKGYDTSRLQGGQDRIMCPECVVKAVNDITPRREARV